MFTPGRCGQPETCDAQAQPSHAQAGRAAGPYPEHGQPVQPAGAAGTDRQGKEQGKPAGAL